jgi:hypothetical protein
LGVSPDVSICEGESTVLTATGAQLYVWTPPTGLNTIFGPTVTASPTTTTTYTVTGASIWNCISQASVTVTVNPLPVVSVAAFDSICSNAAALTLTGGTPAGGTYSGTGVVNNIFTPSVAGIGTHTIEYMYSDGNGCSGSASSTITVKNCGCTAPKIPSSITGPNQLCAGVPGVYSVVMLPALHRTHGFCLQEYLLYQGREQTA